MVKILGNDDKKGKRRKRRRKKREKAKWTFKPIVVRTDEAATKDARKVLNFIKKKARARARMHARKGASKKWTVAGTNFLKVLKKRYLKEYLRKPTKKNGLKAIGDINGNSGIGKKFVGPATIVGPGTRKDPWEKGALESWNEQEIGALRWIRPKLPRVVIPATDILSIRNCTEMPIIDVPFLLGPPNPSREMNDDVFEGGSNISQLMHWANGVKYSPHVEKKFLRELFFGYELWHYEGWDVFEEDPLNDLIAGDAGRHLGVCLENATINKRNLVSKLDEGFKEARAWVGKLLNSSLDFALHESKLIGKAPITYKMWTGNTVYFAWNGTTIYKELIAGGKTLNEVKKLDFIQRIIGIYTLTYEAKNWERTRGEIKLTQLTYALLKGDFDEIFKNVRGGTPSSIPAKDLKRINAIASNDA